MDGSLLLACAAASFVGSLHCAGMCGPLVAVVLSRGAGPRTPGAATLLGAYHGARGAGYMALGAALGLAGGLVNLVGVLAGAAPVAASIAGLTLIVSGLAIIARAAGVRLPRRPSRGAADGTPGPLQRIRGRALRLPPVGRALAIGGTTAFLPCGWLYAFFVVAAGTASPVQGALVMGAFWLGTVPVLSALGFGVGRLQRLFGPSLQVATSLVLIALGSWTLMGRSALSADALATRAMERNAPAAQDGAVAPQCACESMSGERK